LRDLDLVQTGYHPAGAPRLHALVHREPVVRVDGSPSQPWPEPGPPARSRISTGPRPWPPTCRVGAIPEI